MTPFDSSKPEEFIKDGMERVVGSASESFNRLRKRLKESSTTANSDQKLFKALRLKQEKELKALLQTGANPNALNTDGDRPLHIAARNGSLRLAEILLQAGADANLGQKNNPAETPLAAAVAFNKPALVKLLAPYGGYTQDARGWSALHRAAEKNQTEIIEALLNTGVVGNARTKNGATALLVAAHHQHEEAMLWLLTDPVISRSINTDYVHTDKRQRTAFQVAVECGALEAAEEMLALGAFADQADSAGMTPLMNAAAGGDFAMVKLLMNHGARPAGALHALCTHGQAKGSDAQAIIDFLVMQGADINSIDPKTGLTPLSAAALHASDSKILDRLIAHGADPEHRDSQGHTAVFHAVENTDTAALKSLLSAGANPNTRHLKTGATPLHQAISTGNIASAKLLLDAGANPMLCDFAGASPLAAAQKQKREGIAALLLQKLRQDWPLQQSQPGPKTKKPKPAP